MEPREAFGFLFKKCFVVSLLHRDLPVLVDLQLQLRVPEAEKRALRRHSGAAFECRGKNAGVLTLSEGRCSAMHSGKGCWWPE